jgi:two-component system OmpR family sensor kinase
MRSFKLPSFGKRITYFFHSVRFRLVLWFAAILAIVMATFSGFVYYNQSRDIQGEAQFRLAQKMAALRLVLSITPNGFVLPQGILQDTDILIYANSSGNVVTSQGPIPTQDASQLAARAQEEYIEHGNSPNGTVSWSQGALKLKANYMFVAVPVLTLTGPSGLIILGSPLDPLLEKLILTLVAGSLLTLFIALVGGFWLADRAMRPVHTITQTARTIGETDLSRRLNMKNKDELGELANTFDAMLARLQAAFERQRQFVADASHELRTPLTIVNLETSRVLANRRSPEEYQQALAVIHSENDFMSSLVNDLLTLARMDAGQTVIEKVPVDLSDVAVETMERLMPLSNRNGVRLETGELPEVRILGDRKYLIQMISNLVENGIKYTTGEDKHVRIETGRSDGTAWVRVSDGGPGIAPEHLSHLFDRFYRIDKSRTRDDTKDGNHKTPGGSGLGLSIVQWIARVHEGDVHVESTPGVGTTFEARFKAI